MNVCLQCNAPTKRKFCSSSCSNKYNGLLKAEANKDDGQWLQCDCCIKHKPKNAYSFVDKWDYSKGRRTTCKQCNAAKREATRREQTWKHNAALVLLSGAKQRSKRSGMECTLTIEDVAIPDVCPVFGIPLFREARDRWCNAPSIDRIDNTKGYTPDNVVIVSRKANIIKGKATVTELEKIAQFYKKLTEKQS
jgi:hypothetical protein